MKINKIGRKWLALIKINIKIEEMFNTVHIMDQVRNFNTILK